MLFQHTFLVKIYSVFMDIDYYNVIFSSVLFIQLCKQWCIYLKLNLPLDTMKQ